MKPIALYGDSPEQKQTNQPPATKKNEKENRVNFSRFRAGVLACQCNTVNSAWVLPEHESLRDSPSLIYDLPHTCVAETHVDSNTDIGGPFSGSCSSGSSESCRGKYPICSWAVKHFWAVVELIVQEAREKNAGVRSLHPGTQG